MDKFLMNTGKTNWKMVFKFMGAILAFAIGSGFASGQELIQFFSAYGYQAPLVGIIFLAVFSYSNYCFASAGHREKFTKGSQVFRYYAGPIVGRFFDYFSVLFCYMSFIVMVSGAASTLNQQYGLPLCLGGVLVTILACITVLFGLDSVVDIIGKIGPILVGIVLTIGFIGFFQASGSISESWRLVQTGQVVVLRASPNWFLAGLSYGGFCLLWFAGFMAKLGSRHKMKELMMGQVFSGVISIVACVVIGFALLGNISETAGLQIPNLYLATRLWSPFANIYALVIFAAIYTTTCPLLWTVSSRFAIEGSVTFRILTFIFAIYGCIIGLTLPFSVLLNYVYVFNGYGGVVLLLLMIVKNFRLHLASNKCKEKDMKVADEVELMLVVNK